MSPGKKRAFVSLASLALATAALGGTAAAQDEKQTLIYAIDGEITYLNNALNDVPTAEAAQWIHAALYGYDATLTPVPDLATDYAEISEDGLTWTLKLRKDAVFQPTGEPVTADDVVFTYRMSNSPNCRFNPSICLSYVTVTPEGAAEAVPVLVSVEAVNDFTVRFVLADKYAPFTTVILPGTYIDSRKAVRAAFADFEKATEDVTAEETQALVDALAAEGADPVAFRAQMEEIITRAEVPMPVEADYEDEAAYVDALATLVGELNGILQADAIDRIAAAYPLLKTSREPVGAGPFYVTEFRPGQDITAKANKKFHGGKPQISDLLMPIIKDDVGASAALKAGDIDWKFSLTADGYAQLQGDPAIKFARYPDFGYFGLQFNLREGRLFAEKPVRQALAYCIDKPATVEAATDGQGVAIYGDIPPASWAYNPDVPTYDYDPDAAAALLDEAGWVLEAGETVRAKDGRQLATTILVRAGKPDRIKFMQLLADQAKDCGFGLDIVEADFMTVLLPGLDWPHIFPGTTEQWDAYFGGWGTSYDPDPYSLFHSSQCSTPDNPETYNYICFQDARADELMEAGLRELDQAKRAEIYKEFEFIMADELPYLWAWSDEAKEGLRATVNGAEPWTEEVMTTPTWFSGLHQISNIKAQ